MVQSIAAIVAALVVLGLVGIPCYGTIFGVVVPFANVLGLVGIPCYGTITGNGLA